MKKIPFVFFEKGTPSVTFLKFFPGLFIWNINIFFVNPIEVSKFTQLKQSFDIKFKLIFFPKASPMLF